MVGITSDRTRFVWSKPRQSIGEIQLFFEIEL